MKCSGASAIFKCLYNDWVFMQFLGVDAIFGCWCIVGVFIQCLSVYATFGCLCNVQVFMQCSGVDVMFGKCMGVDAMFDCNANIKCWCNARVLIQCSGVYVLHKTIVHSVGTYNIYRTFDAICDFFTLYSLNSWNICSINSFLHWWSHPWKKCIFMVFFPKGEGVRNPKL